MKTTKAAALDLPDQSAPHETALERAPWPGFVASRARNSPAPDWRGLSLVHGDGLLSRQHFFRQLHLEKRRSDRSKAPLSVVLFGLDVAQRGANLDNLARLVAILQHSKRETDVLGYIGEDRIALLLTDTDMEGAKALTGNLAARADGLTFSAACGTYPDQIFDNLIDSSDGLPDTSQLMLDEQVSSHIYASAAKRMIDVVGALVAIALLSPVMLVTALAVSMTSPGPVVFRQTRIGKGTVPFVFYKFRSMVVDADDSIHRDYVAQLIEGNHETVNQGDPDKPHYKIKTDPRLTCVGSFIRRTSIDELPQLFNVLKGDMSLVGPRPPLIYEAQKYQAWHLRRVLHIRPGITGLWQVAGRSRTTFDEMVRMDLAYIRNWSLWLDFKILLKTVPAVLKGDGAT